MGGEINRELAGAITSIGISAAGGDLVGAAATAGGLLVSLGHRIDQLRAAQAEQVLEEAAGLLGSRERLAELAGADRVRLELMARIVESAARTPLPDKIHALAKVLAQGVQDDAVDDAIVIEAALADIEAPHLQLLLRLEGPAPDPRNAGWSLEDVMQAWPRAMTVAPALMTTLQRHGLIIQMPMPTTLDRLPPVRWRLSNLGYKILELTGWSDLGPEQDRPIA